MRPFVRSFISNLFRAVNLHLSRSESTQRAIKQSESSQSIKIRVIQSEPKILRLVLTFSRGNYHISFPKYFLCVIYFFYNFRFRG